MTSETDIEQALSYRFDGAQPTEDESAATAFLSAEDVARARRWVLFEALLHRLLYRPDRARLAAARARLQTRVSQRLAARRVRPLAYGGRLAAAAVLTAAVVVGGMLLLAVARYPGPRVQAPLAVADGGSVRRGARLVASPTAAAARPRFAPALRLGGYATVEVWTGRPVAAILDGEKWREALFVEAGRLRCSVAEDGGLLTVHSAGGRVTLPPGSRAEVTVDPAAQEAPSVVVTRGEARVWSPEGYTILRAEDADATRRPPSGEGPDADGPPAETLHDL